MEAWQHMVRLEPDLVLTDLELPGEGGVELTRRIRKSFPKAIVLILTAHGGAQKINSALEAGAAGYVLKSCTSQDLVSAMEATLAGQIYLSPAASTVIVREYQRQLKGGGDKILSARETETLKRIAEGQTTKEIAFAMRVSTKTVETHRLNLMAKLEVNTVAGLTKYAIREGLATL
jgi:DNA-binding NarL/FixJ family response regulator